MCGILLLKIVVCSQNYKGDEIPPVVIRITTNLDYNKKMEPLTAND